MAQKVVTDRLPDDGFWHPRHDKDKRDEIELFLRDAYAAGCRAVRSNSMVTALEYASAEAPKLRALIRVEESN